MRENLRCDSDEKRWVTKYPWIIDPYDLPDNYSAALATLKHTEKVMSKDETWATVYDKQIQDMVDRKVAKVLWKDEIDKWSRKVIYLSHLAIQNPKSFLPLELYECRRKNPVLLSQSMRQLPIERPCPASPFTSVMLNLFGPYSIRDEVQKRVTGKGYG